MNAQCDMRDGVGSCLYGWHCVRVQYHWTGELDMYARETPLEYALFTGQQEVARLLRAGTQLHHQAPSTYSLTFMQCLLVWLCVCTAMAPREPWSASNHHSRHEPIKQAVTSMMMIRSLQPSSVLHHMPIEIMLEIFAAITITP